MEVTIIGKRNGEFFSPFLFENNPPEGALGIIVDGYAAGAGVFETRGETCIIRHLYVGDVFRRGGAATALLSEAESALSSRGVTDMLASYEGDDAITSFLRANGYTCTSSLPSYSFRLEDMANYGQVDKILQKYPKHGFFPLSKATKHQLSIMREKIRRAGFDPSVIENRGLSLYVEDKGRILGVLFADREGNDVYVRLLVSFSKAKSVPLDIMSALYLLLKKAEIPECRVVFLSLRESVRRFVQVFLPEGGLVEGESAWMAVKKI